MAPTSPFATAAANRGDAASARGGIKKQHKCSQLHNCCIFCLQTLTTLPQLSIYPAYIFCENSDGQIEWEITSTAGATGSKSLKLNNTSNDDGDIDELKNVKPGDVLRLYEETT